MFTLIVLDILLFEGRSVLWPTQQVTGSKRFYSNNIISSNWVKLFGIKFDSRLSFEPRVSDLCKSSARQLNAILRLISHLIFEERKILTDSFGYSNFNYCPLVWNFTGANAINKSESVQKGKLKFLFDDCESPYETLIMKANKPTMTFQRLRYLCAEIHRIVNGLNPSNMKNFFKKSDTSMLKWPK